MSNLMTALSLASSGLYVFPCTGVDGDAGKIPPAGFGWKGESTTDPDKIGRWWQYKHPGATVAIDLGKSGLFVMDCDKPDNEGQRDGVEWFEALALENGADAFPFVTNRTPSGGVHYIFRQPDGAPLGNGRGGLPKKRDVAIDVRGAGGYIIAPGATMQDGRAYVLSGSMADVPAMPEWLIAIMRTKEPDEVAAPSTALPVVSFPPSTERVGSYSRAGFDAEIAEVRTAPKGTRNDTLNTSAFKIGTMVGAGWVSESEAYSALVGAVAGWADQRKTIDTLKRGLREGLAHPRPALPDELVIDPTAIIAPLLKRLDADEAERPQLFEHADGAITDGETGEVVGGTSGIGLDGARLELFPGALAKARQLSAAIGLSPRWLDETLLPPGLVGDISRWIIASARRPIPELALGVALTVVGTAMGRHFATPTLSGTHLYALGLAPTGAGKEHNLQSAQRLLTAAGMQQHIGGSEFMSQSSVVSSIRRQPLSLWPADEFGSFLSRIGSPRAASHEVGISKWMRSLWGASFGSVPSPEWKGEPATTIHWPAMSVLGVSVPEAVFAAVGEAEVVNGFLNRFTLFSATGRAAEREPSVSAIDVPRHISDRLVALYRAGVSGTLHDPFHTSDAPFLGGYRKLEWGGCAHEIYRLLAGRVEAHSDSKPDDAPFFGRTVEQAIRVATIVAAGRGSMTVDAADIIFGADLSLRSASLMTVLYRNRHEDSLHSKRMAALESVLKRAGVVTQSNLVNALKRDMDARTLRGLLGTLEEAKTIERVTLSSPGARGRPAAAYQWIGDRIIRTGEHGE